MNSIRLKITRPCAIGTLLIALLILLNWFLYAPGPGHWFSTPPTVKFTTALCLVLSAVTLYFLDQKDHSRLNKKVVLTTSWVVLLIALLTLCEYIFGFDSGIGQFFRKQATDPPQVVPGRMGPATALLFGLLSLVHLLLHQTRFRLFIQVILIAGFGLLGLIFLVSLSQVTNSGLSVVRATTLHTSLAFLLLYTGTFFSYPLSQLAFSFEKRMVANFSFAILLLTMVFFSLKRTDRKFVETSNLVNHTHEVLLKARDVGIEAAEMQNGLRGYYLTRDESFLTAFHSGAAVVVQQIGDLKALTRQNAGQQARLDSLQQLVHHYILSRKEIIRRSSMDAANLIAITHEGREIKERITALIHSIQQEETLLLARQKAEKEQSIRQSSKAVAVFQVVIGLLMILAFVVVYRNARQRKKAEDQIRQLNEDLEKRVEEKTTEAIEKEKQYRFLVESMQEGVQVLGFDWRYRLVNKAFMRQREKPGEELVGHSILEIYPDVKETALFAVLRRCMEERTPARMEHTNGRNWFELSIEPVPEGLFILSMDITERKNYWEALKKSEAELARAQKIAKLARWEWKAGIAHPSQELLELLHWPPATPFATEDFFNLIYPEDRAQFKRELTVALENETDLNAEFRVGAPGGVIKHMHVTSKIDCDGEPRGFTGTLQDVTDLKRSEAMLKQLNDNLEKRALELKASNTELERFAFVASHDLQEPLRMVSSFLSLLEAETEGQLDEAAKEYIHYAVDGAERMKKLIQALLEYSRLGVSNESRTEVNCTEVMEEVRTLLEFNIRESGAILVVQSLPVVKGVESQLQQLFQNLVGNALKYNTNEQPKIEVGCIEITGYWKFYVRDNGIGIDPRYFEKIFIIFQRLHDKRAYSGTGIGLAICKKIVEKHGGAIWVESGPGQGSTFYFTIPK